MSDKKFLLTIFAIQLAMLGLVGLAILGFDVPVLRQVTGFIYLTFVPGLLLLRILKLHQRELAEVIVYSAGLSLVIVMLAGLFMNTVYPAMGISKPISTLPVIITMSIIVLIMSAIVLFRGQREDRFPSLQWSALFSPPALFLLLLPALSALGAFLVYYHQGNAALLLMLSLVAVAVLLIAFNKFIPARFYPLAAVAIALALLWHYSLVSMDLSGFDIIWEYNLQQVIVAHSIWSTDTPLAINSTLSTVLLFPIFRLVLGLDAEWIIKIFYPLWLSLLPLVLFQAYKKLTDARIAFFGVFFFMSVVSFFAGMSDAPRQGIAELFLALSILLMLPDGKGESATKRAALLILFGFGIVTSHYGLSYVYLVLLLIAMALAAIARSTTIRSVEEKILSRLSKLRAYFSGAEHPQLARYFDTLSEARNQLTGTYVLIVIVFSFTWYLYTSRGTNFANIVNIGGHIYSNIASDFLVPESRGMEVMSALGLASPIQPGMEWLVGRVMSYITQLFIVAGMMWLVLRLGRNRFAFGYTGLSLASLVFLALSVIVPYLTAGLNMDRMYHITLIFLAPFCILGGMGLVRLLLGISPFRSFGNPTRFAHVSLVVILLLVTYFLFQTTFIMELAGSSRTSMPLSLYRSGDWNFYTVPESHARTWLTDAVPTGTTNAVVHTDVSPLLRKGPVPYKIGGIFVDPKYIREDSYIFLRRWNIIHNEVLAHLGQGRWPQFAPLSEMPALKEENTSNKIYDSGTAQILKILMPR